MPLQLPLNLSFIFSNLSDHLCGVVVKQSSWLQIQRSGLDSLDPFSLVSTIEELLKEKVAAPVYKVENTAVGIRHADHVAPSIRKISH
jgi:hypothetical protein